MMVLDEKSDSFGRSKVKQSDTRSTHVGESDEVVEEEAGEVERLPMEELLSL